MVNVTLEVEIIQDTYSVEWALEALSFSITKWLGDSLAFGY
jgi:hypothetical protein